jgi:colicin import membrane protein
MSLVLHLALGAVLLANVDFSQKPKTTAQVSEQAPIINAVAIDSSMLDKQVKKIRKQKADARAAEEQRVKDLEKRAAAARKKRDDEQKRIRNLEQQRKKRELEKKKADDAVKKAQAKQKLEADKAAKAEKARKQKEAERKKAEQAAADAKARRLKEEAEAKKAAQERKRKEQEAKERAEQQRALEEQMAQEQASRRQARRRQMMTEIQKYTALITQTIQRHLITDSATMAGKSCKLSISLAASGFVKNVVPGSGDKVVCDAAVKAVYKAGTLPVSKDPEVFKELANISLTVEPEF